jgi:ATP-dependent DNA ligase
LADYRARYPEMQVLAALPPGTILDGELVLLPQGVPDLEAMLARHQLSHPAKIQHAGQHQTVTYVVFDLLAHQLRSLVGQPLQERRALLQDLLARWREPRVQFSDGMGRRFRGLRNTRFGADMEERPRPVLKVRFPVDFVSPGFREPDHGLDVACLIFPSLFPLPT